MQKHAVLIVLVGTSVPLKYYLTHEKLSLALPISSLTMAGHLLLAVSSLVVYFHVAYSEITAQQILAVSSQFASDFSWPRIKEVAYVLGSCHPTVSRLTEQQCPDQLHWIYSRWYVYPPCLHEVQQFPQHQRPQS